MEKRTLLAVVLSVLVISVFYMVQAIFMPPPELLPPDQRAADQPVVSDSSAISPAAQPMAPSEVTGALAPEPEVISEQRLVIETDLIRVELTNAGGDIVSYRLNEHAEGLESVEMILGGDTEPHAFTVAFGGRDAQPIQSFFHVNRVSPTVVEFYRDFTVSGSSGNGAVDTFRLTKRYDFRPGEYMFELTVTVDGGISAPALNFSGAAYTLGFGPQIGPAFEKLDQRYEYRRYYSFENGKNKQEKLNKNGIAEISSRVSWAAIAGKYFTFIAVPDSTQYEMAFSTRAEPGLSDASRFYLTRPAMNSSRTVDTYRFYLGPKNQKGLGVYDTADNSFKIRDLRIAELSSSGGFLGPLETLLKWFLQIFYRLIPNYGVAIILLTILVKVIMFPFTKKGSESTLRMQSISPKIQEIQTKYKDNPTKMNQEMAELYKKEGYNPLSGCLPMLIQMPIFFAMYNLFNSHFDLRGAMFIPGWIPDLSLPESVWNFAPFRIPILGWSDLRILPFIYVGSQLLYGKVTQTPDQKGNTQMKVMLYAMPVMFFFILYDVPSGLLVYWIMSNVLTMVQQVGLNKYMAQRKAQMAEAEPEQKVIVPPKKRKKK